MSSKDIFLVFSYAQSTGKSIVIKPTRYVTIGMGYAIRKIVKKYIFPDKVPKIL